MEHSHNGLAIAGFTVSLCSIFPLAAGFLCVIKVMLTAFIGFAFGVCAGVMAVAGLVISGIGLCRSYALESKGAGFSLAGVVLGTVTLTLVLAATALLIVAAAIV